MTVQKIGGLEVVNGYLQPVDLRKKVEGYGLGFGPVRWLPYKPDGARQMGKPGRWQAMTDYGGWENCEPPADVWDGPPDYAAAVARIAELHAGRDAAEQDRNDLAARVVALEAENARLREALEAYARDWDHEGGFSMWDGGASARAALAGDKP